MAMTLGYIGCAHEGAIANVCAAITIGVVGIACVAVTDGPIPGGRVLSADWLGSISFTAIRSLRLSIWLRLGRVPCGQNEVADARLKARRSWCAPNASLARKVGREARLRVRENTKATHSLGCFQEKESFLPHF